MGCTSSAAASTQHVDCIDAKHDPETFTHEYDVGRVIGKGSFGKVYTASHRLTCNHCAVKVIEMVDKRLSPEEQIQKQAHTRTKIKAEIETWRAVGKHPNIVEFHASFIEESRAFLVMEKCSGTVTEKLSLGAFRKKDAPWLLRQMLLSTLACHQANIVHRDIKTDNFLISIDGSSVKLCDFGLAVQLRQNAAGACLLGQSGTPPMMSPEMVQGIPYGVSTDVWSYGAMAYYILFKELPYVPKVMTAKSAKEAIRAGEPKPRFLEGTPYPVVTFLRGLLERDPAIRVTATDALEHRYLEGQLKPQGHIDTESTLAPTEDVLAHLGSTESLADSDLSL